MEHELKLDFSRTPTYHFKKIPIELRERQQWVDWRLTDDDKKLPVNPATGKLADTTDHKTWGTYRQATAYLTKDSCAGLGYVFNGSVHVGIDLDDCRRDGVIEPWAQAIIDELDSYTEISQSGTGIHIIVRGKLSGKHHKKGNIELYDNKRYFVMTGNVLPGHEVIASRDLSSLEQRLDTDHSASGADWKRIADLAEKKGITDADELEAAVRKHYPAWAAERDATKGERNGKSYIRYTIEKYLGDSNEPTLKLVRMSEVSPTQPQFLIRPYFPQGCLSLLVGDPGTGKTLIALSIVAHLTTGRSVLGGQLKPMNAIFLSNEDPVGISRWRFQRAEGDASRVLIETYNGKMFTLDQANALEEAIATHRPGFVVIDSVMSHLGRKVDSYRANEVATVLMPLVGIAEKYNTVILGLMHLNKSEASRILYRVQASIGFTAGARSVLALDYDPEQPHGRILCHIKSNNAATGPSQALNVADAYVKWNGESALKAGDLFGHELTGEEKRAQEEAKDFLLEILMEGSMPSDEVKKEAAARDIAWRTVARAKRAAGVESQKTKDGKWAFVRKDFKNAK